MAHTDLNLADYKEMEATALKQLRNGKKVVAAAEQILSYSEFMIRELQGETEGSLQIRVEKEMKEKIDNTAKKE